MHVFPVYTGRYCHWDGWILTSICQYMKVYSSNTCIYINQYMNVISTVYLAVFLYVFLAVYLAIFLYVFPTVFLLYFSQPSRCRQGASRSPAPGHDLCNLRRAVPTASLSRGSASADRPLNSIRSGLRDSGVQRQFVQARLSCALKCHGNVGWRSIKR